MDDSICKCPECDEPEFPQTGTEEEPQDDED